MSRINGVQAITADYNVRSKVNQTGTDSFESYMEEKLSLDDIFERASKKYNVPVNPLKAIGKAESASILMPYQSQGTGCYALMPGTAEIWELLMP